VQFANSLGLGRHNELLLNSLADKQAPYGPDQLRVLNDEGFTLAKSTISAWPGYTPTPLILLNGLAQKANVERIYYKNEGTRFGLGSFKALGGAYAVSQLLRREIARIKAITMPSVAQLFDGTHSDVVSKVTVSCATDGNHGRSVAWGARMFGCNCVILIHSNVSEGRKNAIEAYGATVIRTKGNYDDSVREAHRLAASKGWFIVSDTSYSGYTEVPKDVMQGYELMAAEACDQMHVPPTHIFLQTGVGGMAAAVAAYTKRRYGKNRPIIILADPDKSACWLESVRNGKPTSVHGELDTLMAGLACGEISILAWDILRQNADAVMSVTDDDAVLMMRALANPSTDDPPIVAGESAVAGLAASIAAANHEHARSELLLDSHSSILVFGTESDTDPDLYAQLIGLNTDEVSPTA
jgi:diaminopropionate ammonia-lyase